MHPSLEPVRESLLATLRQISDPVERYQAAKEWEVEIDPGLKEVKAEVAKALKPRRSWKKVGEMLGVTGSRAEQISRAAR
jgi:hypothetical protein